jgi:hypothetical protein
MAGFTLFFGPMLIGAFLNAILYGVVVVQSFIYYQTYKKDAPWIRYFVLYLFIVETMNTGFDVAMMYEPLITNYETSRTTNVAPTLLIADPIVIVAISTPVQLFTAWRIKILSESYLPSSIICFFAMTAFVGGVASTVQVALHPVFSGFLGFQWSITTWLVSSAVCDVAIAISLALSLYNSRTGNSVTDDIINRIIRLVVQTGAITAISAIADVALFLALPRTSLNFIWDLPLSKLYTNSLLSTLNARAGWNNLMGPENEHNVLFGPQKQTSLMRPSMQPDHFNNRGMPTIPYEPPTTKNGHDLEHGISVTKVVERSITWF